MRSSPAPPDGPLVSIIVPVYQVAEHLQRCVESILAQSYPHLEVLLVDDGSSDGGGEICDALALADERVRVHHQANAGLSAARNVALDQARGAYLSFIDGDDWVHPDLIAELLALATDLDADVVSCAFERTEHWSAPGPLPAPGSAVALDRAEVLRQFFGPEHSRWVISCAKLYAAHLWVTHRFPAGHWHEDEFVTLPVLLSASRVVATDAILYFYFQRPGSIMLSPPSLAQRRDALAATVGQQALVPESSPAGVRAAAAGQVLRKQIYLARALRSAREPVDPTLRQQIRVVAAELRRLAPRDRFTAYAQVYARAPGLVDPAHRLLTRVRRGRGQRRRLASPDGRRRLRVLISSGWLGGAGGAERALGSQLVALREDLVDVVVRVRLDDPHAPGAYGPDTRIYDYGDWRWWAAGHRGGGKGWLIQRLLNPARRLLRPRYDIYLRALSGPGLESAVRARHTLIVPSGDHLTPEIAGRYDAVAMQAPDNARLAAGTPTTLLPPPVLPLPPAVRPNATLPQAFLLTVFNPYGAIKGISELGALLDQAPLPLVWCHSTRTVDFQIPEPFRDHPRIVHVEDPSPAHLRFLYEACAAYVSLSRSEGFGWSIVDALRYSPAVVARRIGVLTYPQAGQLPVFETADFTDIDWTAVLAQPHPTEPRALAWLAPDAFRERLLQLRDGAS